MAGTKEIKRRIKSVRNTKKITKAMELVAASKMKKAVSATLSSRLYAEYSWEILTSIAQNTEEIKHPLFKEREVKNILVALITSNRGLCGAYNAQVIKKTLSLLKEKSEGAEVRVIAIGKKGDMAMRRVGAEVIASFFELPDGLSMSDVNPVSEFIISEYNNAKYDKVFVVYTDFISALSQRPNVKQVIPVSKYALKEMIESLGGESKDANKITEQKTDYLFEGDREALIGSLAEKLIKMQVYQMLLESNASEQSSRMVAMKNASDASGDMIDDLTLVFNKARQAGITREISEISAGMASVG